MDKKEYEKAKECIKNKIEYIKEYKEQGEIEKLAVLLQLANDDPLAKAFIEDGLGCDFSSTANAIESYSELDDILRCPDGMAGGFGAMIYYSQTCDFFDRHKDLILEKLNNESFELGCANELEVINKFKCLENENITLQDMITINNEKGECEDFKHKQLKNALAWYAGEETARNFDWLMGSKDLIKPEYLKTAESKMTNYVNNKVNKLQKELKGLKNKYENTNEISM